MSATEHNVRFRLRAKGGTVKTSTEETFVIARADAAVFLKVLNGRAEIHAGEIKLRDILTDALKRTGWKTITVRKKSK